MTHRQTSPADRAPGGRGPGLHRPPWRWLAVAGALLAALALADGEPVSPPAPQASPGAAALLAQRQALLPRLRSSAFGEPLLLLSREGPDRLEGDVHAELPQPFAAVADAIASAERLCELMFLHLNVRGCTPRVDAAGAGLELLVGPKRGSGAALQDRMDYTWRTEASEADYRRVTLSAARGPFGTRDYRIVFEVVRVDAGRSFVHLGYGQSHGALARMATSAYLATAGRHKIGFTVTGVDAQGRPAYVQGLRAAVERNVMRYHLALLAHLGVTSGTPEERLQARLRNWFALSERHAPQLHEMDLGEYLEIKRDDLRRAGR